VNTTPSIYPYPTDAEDAWEEWSCSCGPAAFAALLGKTCAEVRPYFPKFPVQSWANPTAMFAALKAAGKLFCKTPLDSDGHGSWPKVAGLIFIQIDGPWCRPSVPVGAAYRHTHWVAMRVNEPIKLIYDINLIGWNNPLVWETTIMRELVRQNNKATGWYVRSAYEVEL
jgi:hypothetical protein